MTKQSKFYSLPLALIMAGAMVPLHAYSGQEDRLSDDGTIEAVAGTEATGTQSLKPFSGSAAVTNEALNSEGVSVYDGSGGKFTDEEFARLSALPVPGATEAGTEIILGKDTRERTYTTTYPARAKVLITFSAGRCSGVMIGKNTVATAGHCIHTGSGGSGGFYPKSSFRIYAGADGASKPFGFCTAKSLHTVVGWANGANEEFDYGAIKLNCTVGNTVGWYGFSTVKPKGKPSIVQGYPGDKPLQQWFSADKVAQMTTNQIFYKNDTTGGMSGSPVWYDKKGPFMIGIHGYRTHGSSVHKKFNHGKRITSATFNNLKNWKSLP